MQGEGRLENVPLSPSGKVSSASKSEIADEMSLDPCAAQEEGPPTLPTKGPDLKDWAPSRGRVLSAILYTAASGTQPSGGALPSMLPPPILTMEDHVNFATILNPIKDLMGDAIPSSSWKVGEELCAIPKTAIEGWLSALKYLSDVSQKMEGRNRRWAARFPEGSPSKQINFALIKFLFSHLDYPDKSLPEDLSNGMPVVGGSAGIRCIPQTCAPGQYDTARMARRPAVQEPRNGGKGQAGCRR